MKGHVFETWGDLEFGISIIKNCNCDEGISLEGLIN